jgi:hypothetical protein
MKKGLWILLSGPIKLGLEEATSKVSAKIKKDQSTNKPFLKSKGHIHKTSFSSYFMNRPNKLVVSA